MIKLRIARLQLLAAALIAGAAILAAGERASAQENSIIKYGLVSSYSGAAAGWGPVQEASVRLAINDINNAGGITLDGEQHRLKLLTYDHAYDPTKTVSVVRKAVQQDGVRFIEILGGGVIPAAQPITARNDVLLFGSGVGSSWVGPEHPLTFRSYYNSANMALDVLSYVKANDAGADKIVLMYPDDQLGHNTAKTIIPAAAKMGFEVEAVYIGRNMTDFYPVLLKVTRMEPDYVDFGPTPGSQYASIIGQARQLGYKGKFIFSDTADLDSIQTAGVGETVIGSLVAPAWDFNTAVGKKWAKRYRKRMGTLHPWTAQSYDNLLLLKAAIEKANSLDTKKVANALETVAIHGTIGKVSYGGEDHIGINRLLQVPAAVGVISQGEDGLVTK